MRVVELEGGLRLIEPERHGDARGWLSEIYSEDRFAELGIAVRFVQDNVSTTPSAGVVRGLHFQRPPRAQAKLFRVVRGRALNLAVDLRPERFGALDAREMAPGAWIFVPEGFAHGFQTLVDDTEVHYRVSRARAADALGAIDWADPELAAPFTLPPRADLRSARDETAGRLGDCRGLF